MPAARYEVRVTQPALESLRKLKDKRIQRAILGRIARLETDPEAQGKQLVGPLSGLYSLRSGPHRVVYRVSHDPPLVSVVLVGRRRAGYHQDVYEAAKRLINRLVRLGLLEAPKEGEPREQVP